MIEADGLTRAGSRVAPYPGRFEMFQGNARSLSNLNDVAGDLDKNQLCLSLVDRTIKELDANHPQDLEKIARRRLGLDRLIRVS